MFAAALLLELATGAMFCAACAMLLKYKHQRVVPPLPVPARPKKLSVPARIQIDYVSNGVDLRTCRAGVPAPLTGISAGLLRDTIFVLLDSTLKSIAIVV